MDVNGIFQHFDLVLTYAGSVRSRAGRFVGPSSEDDGEVSDSQMPCIPSKIPS